MTRANGWQLSDDAARSYEEYSRRLLVPWVLPLLDAVQLAPGEQVLDVACGTGFVARQAIERVRPSGAVTGVDVNGSMLSIAHAKNGDGEGLRWVQCNVTELPFPSGSFDVAVCQQGLQFFPRPTNALEEVRRVLVPGGRLGVSVWGALQDNIYFAALEEAVARFVGSEAAEGLRNPHAHADPQGVLAILQDGGFVEIEAKACSIEMQLPPPENFVLDHLSAMPVASAINALSPHTRAQLFDTVRERLEPYRGDAGLLVPSLVNIGTARAPQESPPEGWA